MMDLDELRSVQSRERQTDSLQQLRESFYQDAGEFIQQLHRERERAAEQADDPWDAPEVNRLSDDIDTAEQTVEAIYERRVGKIVKMASLAAADMPTEDEGLTAEERDLFDSLVASIEQNRANVEAVIEGEDPAAAGDAGPPTDRAADATQSPDGTPDAPADPTPETATDTTAGPAGRSPAADAGADDSGPRSDVPTDPDVLADDAPPTPPADAESGPADPTVESGAGVDAADLMGGDGPGPSDDTPANDRAGEEPRSPERDQPPQADGGPGAVADEAAGPTDSPAPTDVGAGSADDAAGLAGEQPASTEAPGSGAPAPESDRDVDRATVKITSDVGEIFGVDQRSYDLSTDDVVQLPEANAGPLVERDAAERLD